MSKSQKSQPSPTFDEVYQTVMQFTRDRKWDTSNTSRGLAISISLEANELLEYYQWKDENFGNKKDLESELADIFIYAIEFADKNKIDILPAIVRKLDKMAKKYPVEIFEIEDEAERNKVWLAAKQNYKKDTTL
jgi:NTP pyrophosphatase (non-canonical NTP hydrolase)